MTDPFEILIQQLGQSLSVPLHVDRHLACTLKVHQKLTVQLQMDSAQENLIVASFICELPPGRFRENVLCEALKSNNLPDPRTGILGFLSKTNHLTLHQFYRFASLDSEKLSMVIAGFIDYADLWREAIGLGYSSPSPIFENTATPPSPFGLKR
jgi:hypothetical protein